MMFAASAPVRSLGHARACAAIRSLLPSALSLAAALVIAFGSPAHAATDGQPGATSTGSFDATLTVQPPGGSQIQIFGLDDTVLSGIETHETVSTGIGFISEYFCIVGSEPGGATLSMTQTNLPGGGYGDYFALQGTSDANNDSITDSLVFTALIRNPNSADTVGLLNQWTVPVEQSIAGCNAASDGSVAHELEISLNSLPPASVHRLEGTFTGNFTITVALQ